jgi:hypothetical protein
MRRLLTKQRRTHDRVDAVGPDNDIGFDLAAVSKPRHRGCVTGSDSDAAGAEPQALGGHELAQQLLHVAAVDRAAGGAEMREVAREGIAENDAAAAPAAHDLAGGFERLREHPFLEPKRAQRDQGIRREHNAAAKLAQARRLLVDGDLHAAHQQGARRGQPADTAADHCNAQWPRHPCRLR